MTFLPVERIITDYITLGNNLVTSDNEVVSVNGIELNSKLKTINNETLYGSGNFIQNNSGNHTELSNKDKDDHPQYALTNGTRGLFQAILVPGTTIKNLNGSSILTSGNEGLTDPLFDNKIYVRRSGNWQNILQKKIINVIPIINDDKYLEIYGKIGDVVFKMKYPSVSNSINLALSPDQIFLFITKISGSSTQRIYTLKRVNNSWQYDTYFSVINLGSIQPLLIEISKTGSSGYIITGNSNGTILVFSTNFENKSIKTLSSPGIGGFNVGTDNLTSLSISHDNNHVAISSKNNTTNLAVLNIPSKTFISGISIPDDVLTCSFIDNKQILLTKSSTPFNVIFNITDKSIKNFYDIGTAPADIIAVDAVTKNVFTNTGTVNKFYIESKNIGSYAQISPLPPRTFAIGRCWKSKTGRVFFISGTTGSISDPSVYEFTIVNDSPVYTYFNSLPAGRHGYGFFETNTHIYVVGGYGTGASNTIYYAKKTEDGAIENWLTNPTPLPHSTYYNAAWYYNGYAYAVGGANSSGVWTSYRMTLRAPINSDGTIGTWVSTGVNHPMTYIGYFGNYYQNGNKVWLFGGYTNAVNNWTHVGNRYLYRIDHDQSGGISYVYDRTLSANTALCGSDVVDDKLYVVGGHTGSAWTGYMHSFNINDNGDLGDYTYLGVAAPRSLGDIVYMGNHLYMFGGYTGSAYSNIPFRWTINDFQQITTPVYFNNKTIENARFSKDGNYLFTSDDTNVLTTHKKNNLVFNKLNDPFFKSDSPIKKITAY